MIAPLQYTHRIPRFRCNDSIPRTPFGEIGVRRGSTVRYGRRATVAAQTVGRVPRVGSFHHQHRAQRLQFTISTTATSGNMKGE